MKAMHQKMSILFAGMFGGLNFFPFPSNKISHITGSLHATYSPLGEDGFKRDSQNISSDWLHVKKDINDAFTTTIENEPA